MKPGSVPVTRRAWKWLRISQYLHSLNKGKNSPEAWLASIIEISVVSRNVPGKQRHEICLTLKEIALVDRVRAEMKAQRQAEKATV